MATNKAVEITLLKSRASTTDAVKANLIGLGLRKIGQSVVRVDNPSTRGMIKKVSHMVAFKKAVLSPEKATARPADFTIVGKAKQEEKKATKKAPAKKAAAKE